MEMVTTGKPPKEPFRVACAWCGVVIRLRDGKDSEGMCEGGFRRLLDRHLRTQPRGKARDRPLEAHLPPVLASPSPRR